jgi:hypothetical protein
LPAGERLVMPLKKAEQNYMSEENTVSKEQLLRYLSDDMNLYVIWIQRKEIASWSAIIFYVASIWTLYNAFIDKLSVEKSDLIISFMAVILVGYIVFRFIHSQYSSIHHRNAYTLAIKRVISEFMREEIDIGKIDFSFDTLTRQPAFLAQYLSEEFQYVQPFRGKMHPLRIVLRFWLGWINFAISKIIKKDDFKKLSNPEIQEASLYSLIILMTLFYGYLIYKQL